TGLATGHLDSQQAGSASALFNMLRNLGGSIGIAFLATELDVREKLHSFRLGEAVSTFAPTNTERLPSLTQHFLVSGNETLAAGKQALGSLAAMTHREAYVMSFGDCFYLLGALLLMMLLPLCLCRPSRNQTASMH